MKKIIIIITMIFNIILIPLTVLPGTPIDKDAVIESKLRGEKEVLEELVRLVRAYGYRCDSISAARTMLFSRGFKLVCNRFNYTYEIEDKGGTWIVTIK